MRPTLRSSYRMERYGPEHHEAIVRFQVGLWGADLDVNRNYLRWKFLENPYISEPLMTLAFDGGALVGMRAAFGGRWVVGDGDPRTIPIAGDTLIRPDHRSRGLFRILNDALVEQIEARGYPLALNLSASAATSLRSLRCGWRRVGRFDHMLRAPRSHALGGVLRLLPWPGMQVRDRPRALDMATCVDSLKPRAPIRHVRDEDYFRWRFGNPLFRYRFIYAGRPGLRGYIVLQLVPGDSRAAIIDWVAEDHAVARRLLAAAIRAAGDRSLRAWVGSLNEGRAPLLESLGFELRKPYGKSKRFQPGLLLTRGASSDFMLRGIDVLKPSSWDLPMVVSDGV